MSDEYDDDLHEFLPTAVTSTTPSSSAELQGALCGLLCVDNTASRQTWIKTLFDDTSLDAQTELDMSVLFDDTVQQLNSLDFDFQLDIPDDNAPLASRTLAVSDWCLGLVYGLGVSGLKDDALSPDCQEYLTDVLQISQVSSDNLAQSDSEEGDFAELVEYLRMGLFLMYGELQPLNPDEQDHIQH